MQVGMIGLGRMGSNMVRRLMRGGHTCIAYDHSAEAVSAVDVKFQRPVPGQQNERLLHH